MASACLVVGAVAAVTLPQTVRASITYSVNISKSHSGPFTVGGTGVFTIDLTVTSGARAVTRS